MIQISQVQVKKVYLHNKLVGVNVAGFCSSIELSRIIRFSKMKC